MQASWACRARRASQVSVHCLERGHLMGKIWWSEMELFQRLLQLRQADAQIVQREREAYQAEADMLRRQVEEMQAAATRRPSPCQKPGVIADAHTRHPTSDAGQARCAWATVGGQAGAGWMVALMAARGGFCAFRSGANVASFSVSHVIAHAYGVLKASSGVSVVV